MAFFIELTKDRHNVCCASVGSEATLDLREVFFGDGWYEPVEQDSGKYLTRDGLIQW